MSRSLSEREREKLTGEIAALKSLDVKELKARWRTLYLWAQEFSAQVTAVTIAPSHVEIVAKFAAQAGMESRVTPLLCDAPTVPGENCFDAVLAIDSSSSFPRAPWFKRAARLLRRGGRVFVYDCFLQHPEYLGPFNDH